MKKGYKNSDLPSNALVLCVANVEAPCVVNVEVPNANANAPRLDVDHPPNDHDVVKWGVSRRDSLWGLVKLVMGSPKPLESINKSEPRKYPTNAGMIIYKANENPMGVNRLIVLSCEPMV